MGYRHRYVERRKAYPHTDRLRRELSPLLLLPLQGRWLQQAGFAIGHALGLGVPVTPGRLVLEVDESSYPITHSNSRVLPRTEHATDSRSSLCPRCAPRGTFRRWSTNR